MNTRLMIAAAAALLLASCMAGDAGPEDWDGSMDFGDAGPTAAEPDAGVELNDGDAGPRCICPVGFCGWLPECEDFCGCPVGQTCDEETNTCGVDCSPESDESLCRDHGAVCGELFAWDNCGEPRTVESCGSCAPDEACAQNQCLACPPQSDAELCAAWGRTCGSLTRADNCGVRRTVRCGACLPGSDCDLGTGSCVTRQACTADEQCAAPLARCAEGYCRACVEMDDCAEDRLCDLASHQCIECLNDDHCAAVGSVRCEPTEKFCVACLTGADCEGGWCDAASFSCVEPPPANDGCAGALSVSLAGPGDSASVQGDTSRARDDASSLQCASRGGDVAFTITLGSTAGLALEVTPAAGSALLPVLHARGRCETRSSELGCVSTLGSGMPVRLELPAVSPGSFTLWVDAAEGSSGGFTLAVVAREPLPPAANDTCADPEELALEGGALIEGDTRGATDDYQSPCTYSDGPDLVYRFDLAEPHKVVAAVTVDLATPAFRPAVYLRAACDAPGAEAERACGGPQAGATAIATAARLDAGSWFAIVDGAYGTAGLFELTVSLQPPEPLGDGCADAFALDLSSGAATVRADLAGATDDAEGSCGGSGPDAVYRIDLAQPLTLSASVLPDAALQPVLHLRRDCGQASAERSCIAGELPGDPAGLGPIALEAGSWFLWVDGFGGSRGAFELTVRATP